MEFHLFLPQMRMSFERLVATAQAAEAAGFSGVAGMDHLAPPGAETQPMHEAMITNTWIAAHTQQIRVGSLVLCDAMRHPAMLAREALSVDHASGGRFELGIGWGSWAPDFEAFGVLPGEPRERVQRLRETLEVLKALWSGETVSYQGQFHTLRNACMAPRPLSRIPIVIGGAGPKTLVLVREFADWWNLDVSHKAKFQSDAFQRLRDQTGDARVSVQDMVLLISGQPEPQTLVDAAMRRFGYTNPAIGGGQELVDHFGRLADQGVERVYAWFCDFAPPESLFAFGEEVIGKLRAV